MRACTMTAMAWKVSSWRKTGVAPGPRSGSCASLGFSADGWAGKSPLKAPRVPPPYSGAHWRRHADRRSPGACGCIVIGADLEPGSPVQALIGAHDVPDTTLSIKSAAQVKHQPARCLLQTLIEGGTELGALSISTSPLHSTRQVPSSHSATRASNRGDRGRVFSMLRQSSPRLWSGPAGRVHLNDCPVWGRSPDPRCSSLPAPLWTPIGRSQPFFAPGRRTSGGTFVLPGVCCPTSVWPATKKPGGAGQEERARGAMLCVMSASIRHGRSRGVTSRPGKRSNACGSSFRLRG